MGKEIKVIIERNENIELVFKFENELKTSIDPTKTKLTSKKYSGVSGGITVKVNTNGQVSINGVPES